MEYQYLLKTPSQQSLFLHNLSESLSDAIILVDKEFTIEHLNHAAYHLLR